MATVVAVLSTLPGCGILAALIYFGKSADPAKRVADALFLFGPLCTALPAMLLAVAALLASRHGARALLLTAACASTLLGAAAFAVGTSMGEPPVYPTIGRSVYAAGLFFGPFALLFGLPAALFAALTPGQLRRELRAAQERRILDVMLERGSLQLADLGLAANAHLEEVRELLAGLAAAGRLATHLDERTGRVYTARRLASLRALLVGTIEERGAASFEELGAFLAEPRDVVRYWVSDLVEAGHLGARIEAESVRFDPTGLGDAIVRACEDCGGPMKATGRGVFYCAYCGKESLV